MIMYQAYNTPGIQPRMVRRMLMKKWMLHPVRNRGARGGKKSAMSARQAPP